MGQGGAPCRGGGGRALCGPQRRRHRRGGPPARPLLHPAGGGPAQAQRRTENVHLVLVLFHSGFFFKPFGFRVSPMLDTILCFEWLSFVEEENQSFSFVMHKQHGQVYVCVWFFSSCVKQRIHKRTFYSFLRLYMMFHVLFLHVTHIFSIFSISTFICWAVGFKPFHWLAWPHPAKATFMQLLPPATAPCRPQRFMHPPTTGRYAPPPQSGILDAPAHFPPSQPHFYFTIISL